ncbi:transposase family protein [Streptomyces sp. NPDC001893]|uniref:helix-turn-helix domain-containing protein n=1 Tax=Streptomyces sp. NPDC001893 TaxID=3154530 RepID=UPI00332F6219
MRVRRVVKLTSARAACSHPALSGVSCAHLGELFAELAAPWEAARQPGLREARGGERRRAAGARRKPKLVFCDRLLLALVHLRHQLSQEVLAELYGVDRSTVSTAIRQVRPLLAARGFAVPDRAGAEKSSGLVKRCVGTRGGFRRVGLVGGPSSPRAAVGR